MPRPRSPVRRRTLALVGAALLVAAPACGTDLWDGETTAGSSAGTAEVATTTTAAPRDRLPAAAVPVRLDHLALTSAPEPVVVVDGHAPTPCHEVVHALGRVDGAIHVALAAVPPTGAVACAQVLSAFRTTIALPPVDGPTEVVVDGQEAGVVSG